MIHHPQTTDLRSIATTPRRRQLLFACAVSLLVTATAGWAQTKEPPVSFRKTVAPLSDVAKRTLPPVDTERLRAEDEIADADQIPGPTRFAAALEVDYDLETAGSWDILDDGARLWRLRIESPTALSLNLGFSRFDVPDGARLWIYDSRGTQVVGPYQRHHRAGDGSLWTPVILDDELVIEIYLPAGAESARLELGQVGHGYRFFGEVRTKQGFCNIDAVCDEVDPYRDQARSVGRYIRSGGFLCTGSLLNNTAGDFRPLFLTAQHCGVTAQNASSVVVSWNFESPTCGQLSGGPTDDTQSGATFLASSFASDFALLELDQMPAELSNVYYSGWDIDSSPPQSVVSIHHPNGDEKAAAFEGDALVTNSRAGNPGTTHWRINAWDLGTTEPGSSGSCIFDQATKRCRGVLTAGTASCFNPSGWDVYGKLSLAWTGDGTNETRLSNWLDPIGNGTTFLDGSDPQSNGSCIPDNDTLCLNNNRFKVEIVWNTETSSDPAIVVPGGTGDSSNFWFFSPNNWELLFKVLDGCDLNNRFWVFFAATTDVGFTATVTDTLSGETKQYFNPLGQAANAITDTDAFATCPES